MVLETAQRQQQTTQCQHHWMIEPATSSESRGHCSVCGEQKTFSNTPVSRYDRDAVPRQDRDFRSATRSSHRERIELSDER